MSLLLFQKRTDNSYAGREENYSLLLAFDMRIQREWGASGPDAPGKSQVAICCFRNTGTDPPREIIGPLGSNCFSREARTVLCEI